MGSACSLLDLICTSLPAPGSSVPTACCLCLKPTPQLFLPPSFCSWSSSAWDSLVFAHPAPSQRSHRSSDTTSSERPSSPLPAHSPRHPPASCPSWLLSPSDVCDLLGCLVCLPVWTMHPMRAGALAALVSTESSSARTVPSSAGTQQIFVEWRNE